MCRCYKIITVVLGVLLISGALFGAKSFEEVNRLSDLRFAAMGSAGIAFSTSRGAFIRNPASYYLQDGPLFRLGSRFEETVVHNPDPADPIAFIQKPTAAVEMLFTNKYISLSIGLNNELSDRQIEGSNLRFNAFNDSRIQLTASYGWKAIAFGLFAQGGSTATKEVNIRSDHAFSDYIMHTYLERYESSYEDSQYFFSGFGMLISYQLISIGLLTDSLFHFVYETNELVLDATQIVEGSSVGIAFSSPEYNKYNELRRIVISAAFDAVDLGSSAHRSVRFGFEAKGQFLTTFWVALRGGYQEKRPFGSSLFGLEGSGIATAGLGVRLGNLAIDLALFIPLEKEETSIAMALSWGL
ncbi:MAG: hypothetical protein ACOXZ4_00145 [Sphaerochaetaceae bacterium]